MFQLTYLFLGAIAFLASAATMQPRFDPLTRTTTGTFAMVAWAYWSLSSFSVEVATLGGRVSQSYSGLAAIGIAAAIIMFISVWRLAFGSIDQASNSRPTQR
jgi:hypothetical protein